MKKWLSLIVALGLALSLLAGCGAVSNENAAGSELKGSADGALNDVYFSESESGTGSTSDGSTADSGTEQPQNQKMVHKIWLETETEDLDAMLAGVEQQIAALSGYIESQDRHNGSNYSGSRRYRYAELTIRIPAKDLESFVAQVADSANIVSKKQTAENITLSYVATESRVAALETEQTRLLELLAKAESMSDILEIEKRLTEVRADLEEYTSKLRVYDNLVDYGTIYLDIREVVEFTVVEEPETVWERMGSGFMESLENLGDFFVELFVFIVVALPYLVPLTAAITALVLYLRYRKKKKTPPQEPKQ